MNFKRILTLSLLVLSFKFVLASPAQAYLDPGSGSFIIQIIVASLMGAILIFKIYWKKIKSFFGRQSQDLNEDE